MHLGYVCKRIYCRLHKIKLCCSASLCPAPHISYSCQFQHFLCLFPHNKPCSFRSGHQNNPYRSAPSLNLVGNRMLHAAPALPASAAPVNSHQIHFCILCCLLHRRKPFAVSSNSQSNKAVPVPHKDSSPE